MRTSEEIYHRVRWDPRFDPARFVLGVLQRGAAPKRVPLPAFVPGGDIPWHRVLFVEADGEVVWDRATGVDRIDATEAGRVREPRLLRAPFFTARTPHAGTRRTGLAARARAARGAPASPAPRVRVLTWNTLWDRYDGDRIDTARRRPLLLRRPARRPMPTSSRCRRSRRSCSRCCWRAPWVRAGYTLGTDPRGRDVDACGLLLLSRLPVREAALHVLGPHKAVTAVTVETAAGPLVVRATHLSSDHSEDGAGRRAAELARLAEGLAGMDADWSCWATSTTAATPGPAAALGHAGRLERGARRRTTRRRPSTRRANPLAAVSLAVGPGGPAGPGAAARARRPGGAGGAARRRARPGRAVHLRPLRRAGGRWSSGSRATRPRASTCRPTARTAVAWLPPDGCGRRYRTCAATHDPQVRPLAAAREPALRLRAGVRLRARRLPLLARGGRGDRAVPRPAGGGAQLRAPRGRHRLAGPGGGRRGALGTSCGARWRSGSRAAGGRARGLHPASDAWAAASDPQRPVAAFAARLGGPWPRGSGSWPAVAARGRADAGPGDGGAGDGRGALEPEEPARRAAARADAGTGVAEAVTARVAGALGDGRRARGRLAPYGLRAAGRRSGPGGGAAAARPNWPLVRAGWRRRCPRRGGARGGRARGCRGCGSASADWTWIWSSVATGALDPGGGGGPAGGAGRGGGGRAERGRATRMRCGPRWARAAAAFAGLARQVKAWARARGLDSAPFGGLPGPGLGGARGAHGARGRGPAAADALLREFFGTWAAWDWREPGGGRRPADGPAAARAGLRSRS